LSIAGSVSREDAKIVGGLAPASFARTAGSTRSPGIAAAIAAARLAQALIDHEAACNREFAQRAGNELLRRLVPEGDPHYSHVLEGPDDMPSHVKSALTATSLSIPIVGGRLALGTWQGIYVWEHRRSPETRRLVVHVGP